MFKDELRAAAEKAPRDELRQLGGLVWKALAAGQVTEAEAGEIAATIDNRMRLPVERAERPAPRRVGSKPRSAASLERRRRWVAAGMMPPTIACLFTMGEAAVLATIAAEVGRKAVCSLTVGHVAALAGVSETTVRNALRRAKLYGLVTVQERRLSRRRNASNLVAIVSAEWRTWLQLGDKATRWRVQKRVGDQYTSIPTAFAPFSQSSGGKRMTDRPRIPIPGIALFAPRMAQERRLSFRKV